MHIWRSHLCLHAQHSIPTFSLWLSNRHPNLARFKLYSWVQHSYQSLKSKPTEPHFISPHKQTLQIGITSVISHLDFGSSLLVDLASSIQKAQMLSGSLVYKTKWDGRWWMSSPGHAGKYPVFQSREQLSHALDSLISTYRFTFPKWRRETENTRMAVFISLNMCFANGDLCAITGFHFLSSY